MKSNIFVKPVKMYFQIENQFTSIENKSNKGVTTVMLSVNIALN